MRILRTIKAALLFPSVFFTSHIAVASEHSDRIYPGVFCQLRGDALRGERDFVQTHKAGRNRTITDSYPMWRYLGVSEFGSISNKSDRMGMPVICPIESDFAPDSNEITVRVKFRTLVRSTRGANDNEFRCALMNVNDQGTGVQRSVQSTSLDLNDAAASGIGTLTLSLPNSTVVESPDSRSLADAGAYVLACWLPGVREDAKSGKKIESKLIQYAVHTVDRDASYASRDSNCGDIRQCPGAAK